MALRARVDRRRADLVLRAPLCGTAVGLLFLGDCHSERKAQLRPAAIGLGVVVMTSGSLVQIGCAHRAQTRTVLAAEHLHGRLQGERVEAVEAYLNSNTEVASRVYAWRMQRETLRDQLASKAAEPVPARLRISNIRAARRQSRLRQFRMIAASAAWLFAGGAISGTTAADPPYAAST